MLDQKFRDQSWSFRYAGRLIWPQESVSTGYFPCGDREMDVRARPAHGANIVAVTVDTIM